MTETTTLLRGVSTWRSTACDVQISQGVISAIGPGSTPAPGAMVVECRGATLLPGLHDHHIHALATAAARTSISCGPPVVTTIGDLRAAVRAAEPVAGWIRGIDYFESVAGEIDRDSLDSLRHDVPIRIAHRSGALWVLNSTAIQALGVEHGTHSGIERDNNGRCTGRMWRMDTWLAECLGTSTPDLRSVAHDLLSYGVTGVTDATPGQSRETARVVREGLSPLHVLLLGLKDDADDIPVKIILADHDLAGLDEVVVTIRAARPRPVAVHSVTRASLLLLLIALSEVGTVPGDRIEHAAVTPPEARAMAAKLGVAVVTQPSLVALRGDSYLDDVDPDDLEFLWPFHSLRAVGVTVACSSDAPYGELDPWASIAAATARRAPSGRLVSPHERVDSATALRGYLASPTNLSTEREVSVGSPADLVLLDGSLDDVLADPTASRVRLTIVDGTIVYEAGSPW